MYVVRVKPGVQFTTIAPGGFTILGALVLAAPVVQHDITITSACDGLHSGPDDPHHSGEAYDIRTKDVPDKENLLSAIMSILGWTYFYGFIEDAGTDNEHIHVQRKRGTIYPPVLTTHDAVQDAVAE